MLQQTIAIILISLALIHAAIPQIPQQFYAETRVVSTSNGIIESEQHDTIWYNAPANKMKAISVDTIFGTNNTHIYRGDIQREYYILNDVKCYYLVAPTIMKEKLQIRENSTFKEGRSVDGVACLVWEYAAVNEAISYYLKKNDMTPFRIVLESGDSVTTIDFIQFKSTVPDNSVFEVKNSMACEIANIGIKNPTREDVERYFEIVPLINHPNVPEAEESNLKANIDPATLILIGKTLWAIIKENKPEANLEANLNAVVPKGTTWTDMAGWRQSKWPGWQWTLVNGFGATVVDYKWSFNFLCNGNYQNLGKYIENAGAFPMDIQVAWGYSVNVKGQVLNPFNYGTIKDPVAGLTLSMTMDSNTVIKKITQTCIVNLLGDCSTQLVSCNGYKEAHSFSYVH